MRAPPAPIRRVIRGTEYSRRPYNRQDFPVSSAIQNLLAEPTWSVRSLLPPARPKDATSPPTAAAAQAEKEVTKEKLHHLLKLSALPLPKSTREESEMLKTLRDQVHFVRAIQSVDTTGVKPLITIRDETPEALEEQTINLETMMPYLKLEEKVGRNGTVRRRDVERTPVADQQERARWEIDVSDLGEGSQQRRKGKFFYVRRGKDRKESARPAGRGEKEDIVEPTKKGPAT